MSHSPTTPTGDSLVVIGNFDGVHRGHQSVLAAARSHAGRLGITPRLMTFHPHPAVTLGRTAPPMLTRLERKLELARRYCPGLEPCLIEFTTAFAQQTPEAFVQSVLTERLHARAVMVGANFRFGRGRSGGIDDLRRLGAAAGFEVLPTDLEGDENGPWSSTRVRKLIAEGKMTEASDILGRPHMVSGTVTKGDQRGRKLGFPTCNVVDAEEVLPPHGVYAVLIDKELPTESGEERPAARVMARGVANLGIRPTIGDGNRPVLEAHAFDFSEDVYGETLRIHLVERLREEKKFDGLDALQEQIKRDSDHARALLESREPEPHGAWT